MEIRVLKSSKSSYWYSSHLGEKFSCISTMPDDPGYDDHYWVFIDKNTDTRGYIMACDGEVVKEELSDQQKMISLLKWCLRCGFLNIGEASPEAIVDLYNTNVVSDSKG